MNFANNLKLLREAHNISQKQLAEYLQVSRPTVAGYETKNRQPDFERLTKISQFFNVSIDYLITGSDISMDANVTQRISEKVLDKEIIAAYRKLSFESKQNLSEYIKLLQLKDKMKKNNEGS